MTHLINEWRDTIHSNPFKINSLIQVVYEEHIMTR